jgi:integrase
MAIFKRGRVYWYHFVFSGSHIQRSTKQGNPRVARQIEAAHRTALAKGEVGIIERRLVPTLKQFVSNEFMPWVQATFKAKHNTFVWYRGGTRRLGEFELIANARLDEVTGEKVAAYVAHRQAKGLSITAINRELQILRRIQRIAVEWGRIKQTAKIKMLPGELKRERVLSPEEEARYLSAVAEPLLLVATVLVDSGLRPEECFRLRWEYINFVNGRYGTMLVPHGKTPSARRVIPMTRRVRSVLELQSEQVGKPEDGWVFPANTKSGHVEPSTLRSQHRNALKLSNVRPFVLYTLRHTFLTRLGESGCDVWTLARIAGHSTIAISARYVHPSEDAILCALSRLDAAQILKTQESSTKTKALPS